MYSILYIHTYAPGMILKSALNMLQSAVPQPIFVGAATGHGVNPVGDSGIPNFPVGQTLQNC